MLAPSTPDPAPAVAGLVVVVPGTVPAAVVVPLVVGVEPADVAVVVVVAGVVVVVVVVVVVPSLHAIEGLLVFVALESQSPGGAPPAAATR